MNQALQNLRSLMAERHLDAYLISACDFHQSEYFCDYFWTTRFLSGFTGENCTIVVTPDEACLWTDGRFFVQAEEQMDEAFTLMRMGVKDVPTVSEYLKDKLPEGGTFGFDGRLMSIRTKKELEEKLADKKITFSWKEDLMDLVWTDRPPVQPSAARRGLPCANNCTPPVLRRQGPGLPGAHRLTRRARPPGAHRDHRPFPPNWRSLPFAERLPSAEETGTAQGVQKRQQSDRVSGGSTPGVNRKALRGCRRRGRRKLCS